MIKRIIKYLFSLEDKKRIVNCWKCNAENEENENFNFCVECLTHL